MVWSDDAVQYIISALEPADVDRIILDEDTKTADIIFATNDQLARAIGSQGQNVRLASKLTGYRLNMMLEDNVTMLNKNQNQSVSRPILHVLKSMKIWHKPWWMDLPHLKKLRMSLLRLSTTSMG